MERRAFALLQEAVTKAGRGLGGEPLEPHGLRQFVALNILSCQPSFRGVELIVELSYALTIPESAQ